MRTSRWQFSTKFAVDTTIRCLVIALLLLTGEGRWLGGKISGGRGRPLPTYWYHSKGNWMRYTTLPLTVFIMKLCSTLFVLYCRSRPKDDSSSHFDPHFEDVRGGIEPWWIARWKARAEFLLRVIELPCLSLTADALQGKMCQHSLPSGVGRSLGAKISGGKGRLWGIFCGFYKTRHILLSNGANCTVLCAVVLTQYRRVTDGRTDRRNCCS